jgi:hypothetical protein
MLKKIASALREYAAAQGPAPIASPALNNFAAGRRYPLRPIRRLLDLIASKEGPARSGDEVLGRLDRIEACGLHDYLAYRISALSFHWRLAYTFDGLHHDRTEPAAVLDVLNQMRP